MRISEGVEWAAHCAVLLAALPPDGALPAARLADFHDVPPAYLAKVLQLMARRGLVESLPGRSGGYRLARPADAITLLDVVLAVDGDEPAFRCTEIRRRGPSAVDPRRYKGACGVSAAMWRAEDAYRASLAETTIADLVEHTEQNAPVQAMRKGAVWLGAIPQARLGAG